jgi:hypothetical protein
MPRPTRLLCLAALGLALAGCTDSAGSASSSSSAGGASGTTAGASGGAGSGATSGTGGGAGSTSAGSTASSSSGASSGGGSTGGAAKSAKRGVAYDFASSADLATVSTGVSWWYDWGTRPNAAVPTDYLSRFGMEFVPMLWNGNFDAAAVEAWLQAHPEVHHLLVLNEPNLTDQANLSPDAAAQLWPQYEAVAAHTGVQLVGPAITWGTMSGYSDPVTWLDAFYAAYRDAHGGRDPQIDALAFHWYDYGLGGQLDRLAKYGKPFWVTEFANWHSQNDGAQIDTLAKQEAQLADMVATCESRADVQRYAWFTGRLTNDPHFDSLLAGDGALTDLGQLYLSQPHD